MKRTFNIISILTIILFSSCTKDNESLDDLTGTVWVKDKGGKDGTYLKLSFIKENNAGSDLGLGYWENGDQKAGIEGNYIYEKPDLTFGNNSGTVSGDKIELKLVLSNGNSSYTVHHTLEKVK